MIKSILTFIVILWTVNRVDLLLDMPSKRTSAKRIVPLALNQDGRMLTNPSKCEGISASLLLQQYVGRVEEARGKKRLIGLGHVF